MKYYIRAIAFGLMAGVIVAVTNVIIVIFAPEFISSFKTLILHAFSFLIPGIVVARSTQKHNVVSAIMGGVLSSFSYILFIVILATQDYYYTDDMNIKFWVLSIVSFVGGAIISYIDPDTFKQNIE